MKNKGFTLIELLAVIVILAIIALIAVPIVLNIIKDTKESATIRSAELYIDAVNLAVTNKMMNEPTFPQDNVECTIQAGGNLSCENYSDPIIVEVKGDIPKAEGKIYFTNGKVTSVTNFEMPDGSTFEYTNGKLQKTTGSSNSGGNSVALSTIESTNYGDYIDLGQNVVGTSSTSDDWRIIYNDTTNGKVYAILADYLPVSSGTTGATIASAAGLDTMWTYGVYSNTDLSTLLAGLRHATAWNSLIPSSLVTSGASVKGAMDVRILAASYNQKHNASLDIINNYQPYLRTDPSDNTSSIDTLYMPHLGSDAYDNSWGYWLADAWAFGTTKEYMVDCRGFVDVENHNFTKIGVCPVVSLPSNIQVISTTTNNVTVWSLVNNN